METTARDPLIDGFTPVVGFQTAGRVKRMGKRIRKDDNYWEQVDMYVAHHSEAQFSHGICPTCFETVKAEFETG